MSNNQWEEKILGKKVAVSDTVNFLCGSASISCYDPDHGKIYTVYHASRTKYGEAWDCVMLAVIPVAQPHRTENIIVVESGVPIDGVIYKDIIEGNCIFVDGKVRVYFRSWWTHYFYVDFDPVAKTFSKIKPVLFTYDGSTRELVDTAYAEFLESRKLSGYDFTPPKNQIINTCKMQYYEGYWYGAFTSEQCQPVVYRSKDGIDFELLGVINNIARYECQIAILRGRMYCLLRGTEGDNYYISDDLGVSFRPSGRIESSDTRPQLIPYQGKVLMAVSFKGVEPNLVRDGRNNMKLLIGEGENPADYQEIFHIKDPYGIVYYDIINYKGVLYMIWSNADLYLDKNIQGKDLLYYAQIGDLTEYARLS